MKEHMNIKADAVITILATFHVVINVMVLIIAVQAMMLARRPVNVPVTTIEINGETYTGQIWGKDGIYAILDGEEMRFVAEKPGSELTEIENWMQLKKSSEANVKRIVIDESISSITPKAFGTTAFKGLESLVVEGHQSEVGAYAFSYIPENSSVEFEGGVDEFGINALYDHNPDCISGADPGEDALHYNPFK